MKPEPDAHRGREIFEAYLNDISSLLGGGRVQPNWLADGSLWLASGAPENVQIHRFDPKTGAKTPLFDVARVRAALTQLLGFEPPYRGLPFSSFTDLGDGEHVVFKFQDRDFKLSRKTSRVEPLAAATAVEKAWGIDAQSRSTPRTFRRRTWLVAPAPAPEVASPDRQWLAGIKDHNIYLRSTIDGRETWLTTCGGQDHAWDIETVRLKLTAGPRVSYLPFNPFSPDGLNLFACKVDSSRVFKVPVVHYLKPDEEVEWVPYTRAGAEMDTLQPYLISLRTGRQIRLDVGEARNQFFHFQGWLRDSSEVVFVRVTRDFKTITVLAANASTGAVRTLLQESASTFVRIQHDVIYFNECGLRVLPDGSGFIWQSERSGWKHLYRYDMQGKLRCQLTSGAYAVTEIDAVDAKGGWLYFSAHTDSSRPYDVHLCRVPLAGGEVQTLTSEEGLHEPAFSPDFSCFVDVHSSVNRPPQSELRRADGTRLGTLAHTDMTAITRLGWTAPEEFTVKAADGRTDLWGVLYKPHDFDPDRKYPVIEYIYGGPQLSMVPRTLHFQPGLRMSNLNIALPHLGYIVVILDARGTPERSKEFQDVTYGDWGQHVVDDHAAALKQLAESRPYLDTNRVGIWGHSWGGHFSFRCLAAKPDTYHAALSSAPGYSAWDALIYEPYLDLPERNKAAYDASSCFALAGQVKGKLMIVAGSSDFMCYHDALEMSRKLIEHDVDHELVILAEELHAYVAKAEDYLIAKFVKFFDEHVKHRRT